MDKIILISAYKIILFNRLFVLPERKNVIISAKKSLPRLDERKRRLRRYYFEYDQRLGIDIPMFNIPWEELTKQEQQHILYHWEQVRSTIPDKIKALEREIKRRELQLQIEDDFPTFCRLSAEITDLASKIIDLNLWFRTHDEITADKVHQ